MQTPVVLPVQTPPPNLTPPPPWPDWLAAVRAEALTKGISQVTIDQAFTGLEPDPVVIARDRTQPELTQSLDAYLDARLSLKTLTTARAMIDNHRELLARVQSAYGIPGPVMLAIWGLESNFGQFVGVRPTIVALATLAYDSRRPALFRAELFSALTIADRGLIPLTEMKGSWAGAMGQPQFMPSSYLRHAVDFDADGRTDIWTSEADVFGSMANYLKAAGWKPDERWGREVKISKDAIARIEKGVPMRTAGCRALREMTQSKPLDTWKTLGVTTLHGNPLPASTMAASLVRGVKRYFLVYSNYEAFIGYNCSNSYAVAAGLLSDALAQDMISRGDAEKMR